MVFIRNIDPVESMKIGRRENAIEIIGVIFTIEGSKINSSNSEFIYNFLKRLENLEFPDPLYHPHSIRLLKSSMVEDHTSNFIRATMSQYGAMHRSQKIPSTSPPVMKREISEIRLGEFAGKTIIFMGNFLLIPSIKQLEEKAPWLVRDEEQEEERILNQRLREIEMAKSMKGMLEKEADSERQKQEMKYEYERARLEIIKNATFNIKLPHFKGLIDDSII
jgi:hypothetical protein